MDLVVFLFLIYLLIRDSGASYGGRVVTNRDCEDYEPPVVDD